jgi:predicted patatin/cPLA2 family phospholipase
MAAPAILLACKQTGKKLMDGGISDSIPIRYAESIGYNRNIVILTQPRGYIKKKTAMMGLIKLKYRKYPKLVQALRRRHEMYNETTKYIFEKEAKNELFVICPSEKLPISRIEHDPKILKQVYEIGRETGLRYLNEVKMYLSEN